MVCFQITEEAKMKVNKCGDTRRAWMKLSIKFEPTTMGSQEKDCKRNLLSENCMMQNNTKNWITVLELLRGYLQNLEVHIDDSEMMTHILSYLPEE